MKAPRDILVAGTGFLFGMIFCYFLMVERGPDRRGPLITAASFTGTVKKPEPRIVWPVKRLNPKGEGRRYWVEHNIVQGLPNEER